MGNLYLCNPETSGLCNNGKSETGSAFNSKEQAIFNYKDCRIVILKGKIESEKTSVILNASDDPYDTTLMKKFGGQFIRQELQFGKPILVELEKDSKVSADYIIHLKLPIDQNEMDELFDQDELSMIQKPSRFFLEAFQLANDKNLEDLTYTDNQSIYRDQGKSAEYFFTGLINFLNGRQSQGLKTVRFINIDQRIVQIYNDSLNNQQLIFERDSQQYQLLDKTILKNQQEDQFNQLGTQTKKNYDQVTSQTQVSVTSQEKDKTEQNIRQIEYVAPLKSNKKELPVKQIEKDLPIKQVEKEQPVKQIPKEQPIKQIEKEQPAKSIEKQQPTQQIEKQPIQKVETVQPIKEQVQPIKQIVNEQPVKQIEKEQPVKQIAKEQPVKQIEKEQPVKQIEKEQPVKQIEKEQPVKQIAKEQPVKQLEKEQPVKQVEKEQPVKQIEKQQPVIQIEKQSVKQVEQVSPTKPNEVLPGKAIEKLPVQQVEQVSPLKQTKQASPAKLIEKEQIVQVQQSSKPTIVKKEVSPAKLVTTQEQKNLLKILLDKNQTADKKQELYNKSQNQKSHEVPQQEDDFYDVEVPEGIVQDQQKFYEVERGQQLLKKSINIDKDIQKSDEKSDNRQSDQFSGLVQDAEDSYQDVNEIQSGEVQVQSSDQQDYDEKDNEEKQRPQIKQQAKQPYQSSQSKQTQEKSAYVEKKGSKGKGRR